MTSTHSVCRSASEREDARWGHEAGAARDGLPRAARLAVPASGLRGRPAASAFGAVAGYPPLPRGDRMPTSEPMAAALAEARSALGWTPPHPAVGAVVVRDGAIVGAGHTQPPGGNHAEVEALAAAGGRAPGATVFVTLESCTHHGRTPRLHDVHGLPAPPIPCIQPCNAPTRSWSLSALTVVRTRRAAWRGVPRAARLRGAAGRPCRGRGRRGQRSSTGRTRRRRGQRRAIGHR